ncbi:MAG: hypothetical protein ACFFAU_03315 [Candidatus Hodarchaeota archaeon]
MSKQNNSHFYFGSLITSILGAILIVLFDFAGWYNYDSYNAVESWGYVDFSLQNLLVFPIILIIAGCLFYCAYLSYIGLSSSVKRLDEQQLQFGLITALIALVIVLFGGIIFIIVMLMDEPTNWWFDIGFFGSIIGSGLTLIFFYLTRSNQ